MKKTTKTLTVSLIAAAVALASFACVAALQGQKVEQSKEPSLTESKYYSQKKVVPAPKIYAEGTSGEKVLKYEKTMHGRRLRML